MELTTYIKSPRMIVSGRGAWEGTLGELLERDFEKVEDRVMLNHGLEKQPSKDELLKLISLRDLEEVLDDPNVEVI